METTPAKIGPKHLITANEFAQLGRIARRRKHHARLEVCGLVKEMLPALDPMHPGVVRLRELFEILR
jgi:hypothetical protein